MADLGTILTAIVTPFDDDLNVNEEAFVAMLRHLADHGSDGAVVCGSTGEAAPLDHDEHLPPPASAPRAEGWRDALVGRAAPGRPRPHSPIVAGAGSTATRHAVHLAERVTAA